MPDRDLRKRVVLLTRDNIPRIQSDIFDPSTHEIKPSAEFAIVREGAFVTIRAEFVKVTPRFILYREQQ